MSLTERELKDSINAILYANIDSKLVDNFTKSGKPKPASKRQQKDKKPKVIKEKKPKVVKDTAEAEEESEISESEAEFSGSGSSEEEDIPLKAEDDDSFKPTSKTDAAPVAATRHSL